jgi:uncharacterized glyoxalase superfamily protein PhnB
LHAQKRQIACWKQIFGTKKLFAQQMGAHATTGTLHAPLRINNAEIKSFTSTEH